MLPAHIIDLISQKRQAQAKFLKDCSLSKTQKDYLTFPPLTGTNRALAYSDKEKVDFFSEHLFNVFMPHPDIPPDLVLLNSIAKFLDTPFPVPLPAKTTPTTKLTF